MHTNNIWRTYIVVSLLSVAVIAFSAAVFVNTVGEDRNTVDNLITFVMTIFSVLVALLAYHISVKTFVSIDSVNAISRMDGNVMENENYRTEMLSLMRRFDAVGRDDISDQILCHLEGNLRSRGLNSGARLADYIQGLIDISVLFSLIIKRRKSADDPRDPVMDRIVKLIAEIDGRVDSFEQLSEGSCILMRESVMLIKAIYNYQSREYCLIDAGHAVTMLDVRGAMLKNAISRTIYFNYMGLLFLSKCNETISRHLADAGAGNMDAFSIDAARHLSEMPQSQPRELIVIYLREACRNFDKAVENISDELMWNAFIQYNKARAQYLLSLLEDADMPWEETMHTAIDYRYKLVTILNDVMGGGAKSYFQRAFADQLTMSTMMFQRMKIARGLVDSSVVVLPEIGDDEFLRLSDIYSDIQCHKMKAAARQA